VDGASRQGRLGRASWIVEDDESSLELATRLVESMGHTVLRASDGTQGLALARSEPPDLLLVDLHIPGISGFDVARELRKDERLRVVPVIAVSAGISADRAEAMSAGCDDFVSKPYQPEDLRAAIRRSTGMS
jgi:two-component system cell cycle response regulator DivK